LDGDAVIRRRTAHRWVAWLAIAAVWLLVAAPTVSRSLAATDAWPQLGAWCTGHGLDEHHPSAPDAPGLHTDECGYCALLGHSPALTGHVAAASVAAMLPAIAPIHETSRHGHPLSLLSANPRGPPQA
jgi:hypothetical protein